MKFSLAKKITALMVAPVIVSLMLILWLVFMLNSTERSLKIETHSKDLSKTCSTISSLLDSSIEYINRYCVTGGKSHEELNMAMERVRFIDEELGRLQQLVDANPEQKETLATILFFRDRLKAIHAECEAAPSSKQLEPLWQVAAQFNIELRKLTLYETQKQSLTQRKSVQQGLKFILYATFLNVSVSILVVIFFARPLLRRLKLLDRNTQRFARQDNLIEFDAGSDEIADIDKTFRAMASTLSEYVRKEQAMVENANDIICSLDQESRCLRVNRAVTAALGYEPAEMIERCLTDFVIDSMKESTKSTLESAITNGNDVFEISLKRKDGNLAIFSCSAHWSDQDKALFCVLHDITERKKIARLKQDFVAMVSHDLRTPLMSIEANLTMLEQSRFGELTPAGRKTIKAAERNAHSLLNLISGILDIEKLESGKFTLEKSRVQMDVVLARSMELVVNLADKRQVTIEHEKNDIQLFVDEDRMVQVITNLLSNAIKYSPKQGLIKISSKAHTDCAEVRIDDQGRGIPQNMKTSIFDRFQQVELADSKEKGGSGLGLAICKSIVEAHGGTIGVDSVEGKGSSFWVKLPFGDSSDDENGEPDQSTPTT